MGHYAAELMCDDCGNLRCTCPSKPDKTLHHYLVDTEDQYRVITKADFIQKYTTQGMYPWVQLCHVKLFKKKEDAIAHVSVLAAERINFLTESIKEKKKQIRVLQKLLKDAEA